MQIISEKNGSRNSSDDLKITQFTRRGDMLILHCIDEQHPENKAVLRLNENEFSDLARFLAPECNVCDQRHIISELDDDGVCTECRGSDQNEDVAECPECGLDCQKFEIQKHGMCDACHYDEA